MFQSVCFGRKKQKQNNTTKEKKKKAIKFQERRMMFLHAFFFSFDFSFRFNYLSLSKLIGFDFEISWIQSEHQKFSSPKKSCCWTKHTHKKN